MKKLFIDAEYVGEISLENIPVEKLPKRIGLVTSVQFVSYMDGFISFLEEKGKQIFIDKGRQKYPGQVLGCEQSAAVNVMDKIDAFLYVGDGQFHPLGVALKTKKDVYTFNPKTNLFTILKKEEVEKIQKQKKANLLRFYSAENIGVLVSTKPGQQYLKKAFEIKKKFNEKNIFIFVFDTLDKGELENFNFIDAWVNTACPRISDEKRIVNYSEII